MDERRASGEDGYRSVPENEGLAALSTADEGGSCDAISCLLVLGFLTGFAFFGGGGNSWNPMLTGFWSDVGVGVDIVTDCFFLLSSHSR